MSAWVRLTVRMPHRDSSTFARHGTTALVWIHARCKRFSPRGRAARPLRRPSSSPVGLSLWPIIAGLIVGGVIAVPFVAAAELGVRARVGCSLSDDCHLRLAGVADRRLRRRGSTAHLIPPQIARESYRGNHVQQHVFTQPGSFADISGPCVDVRQARGTGHQTVARECR